MWTSEGDTERPFNTPTGQDCFPVEFVSPLHSHLSNRNSNPLLLFGYSGSVEPFTRDDIAQVSIHLPLSDIHFPEKL